MYRNRAFPGALLVAAAGALMVATLGGCTKRTEVVVGLVSDLKQPQEIDGIDLQVQDSFDDVVASRQWELGSDLGYTIPGSFGLVPKDDPNASFTITLRGGHIATDNAGNTTFTSRVMRKVQTSFVEGRTLFLRVGLVRSCFGRSDTSCPVGTTCVDGSCRDQKVDATLLPSYATKAEYTSECGDPSPFGLTAGPGTACAPPTECIDDSCQLLGGTAMDQLPAIDSAMPDTAMPDAAMPDLSMPDLSMPDLLMPDLSIIDQRPNDALNPDLIVNDASSVKADSAMPDLSQPADLATPDLFQPDATSLTPPTVLNVSPTTGPAGGRITVAVTGSDFAPGATVTVGGKSATGVSVVNSGRITFTLPAGAAGGAFVVVTNSDGQHDRIAFTYYGGNLVFGPQVIATTDNSNAYGLAVADFNKDGRDDVVVPTGGGFDSFRSGVTGVLSLVYGGGDCGGSAPGSRDAVAADFNRDGKPDIAEICAGNGSQVTVYYGNGDNTFTTRKFLYGDPGAYSAVAAGDLNGDKFADLAIVNNGSVNVFLSIPDGNGGASFASQPVRYALGVGMLQGIVIADLDGDGANDIAASAFSDNSNVATLRNADGLGMLVAGPTLSATAKAYGIAAGRIKLLAPVDLVTSLYSDETDVFLNTSSIGSLSFSAARAMADNDGGQFNGGGQIAAGDLDGDGYADVVRSSAMNNHLVLFNNKGDGTGAFASSLVLSTTATQGLYGVALGDLNGDKKPDVVAIERSSMNVYTFINQTP